VLVQLTHAGQQAVDAVMDGLLGRERDLLDGLAVAEQQRLASLLRALVAPLDQPA
jgi:hypothetical protein